MGTFRKFFNIRHYEKRLLIVVIAGFIVSLPLLLSPMVAEPDAYSRSIATELFKKDLSLYQFKYLWMWLPFHFIILGVSLFFYDNIFFTPRLVTLLFSLGSVMLMYYYYLVVIDSQKNIAFLASLLFLLFPLRLFLSIQTLSEPIFMFFFLAALVLLFKKKPNYLGGLVFLNIAHGMRFESWFVLPLIWWYFINKEKITDKEKIYLIFFSVVFPLFWMFFNFRYQGSFFASFNIKYASGQSKILSEYWNFPLSLEVWWQRLVELVSLPVLLISGFGAYKLLERKLNWKQHLLIIFPVYLFFLLVIQVFVGSMEWFPHRYLYTAVGLIVPFMAFGIAKSCCVLRERICTKYYPAYIIIVTTILLSFLSVAIQTRKYTSTFVDAKTNLFDVLEVYWNQKINNDAVTSYYYYTEKESPWLESAFQYFLHNYEMPIRSKVQISLANHGFNDVLIVEKDSEGEVAKYPSNYILIYESSTMMVLRPK